MVFYFIFTTSLVENEFDIRKTEYEHSLNDFMKYYQSLPHDISDKIIPIIVENNIRNRSSIPNSFLDNYPVTVFYTNTNSIVTNNRGIKELLDIQKCIEHFNIQDDDFIIKMTGRYCLDVMNSPFLQYLEEMIRGDLKTECIIRYGTYQRTPIPHKIDDCVTGLIGMKCEYVKQIPMPKEKEFLEHLWAKVSILIPDNRVKILTKLGIHIAPGGHRFFLI